MTRRRGASDARGVDERVDGTPSMDTETIPDPPGVRPDANAIVSIVPALAVASIAAAAIHFVVMGEHFEEYFAFGVFFAIVAWVQALWGMSVAAVPSRGVLITGALLNAIVIAVWTISRTAGIPFGPEAGTPEPISSLDALSTGLEAGIVIGALLLSARRLPQRQLRPRGAALAAAAPFAVAIGVLTTAAAIGGTHMDPEVALGEVATPAMTGGMNASTVDTTAGSQDDDHSSRTSTDPVVEVGDLGEGRSVNAILEPSRELHLEFLDAQGRAVGVVASTIAVEAISISGEEVTVPVGRLDASRYVANLAAFPSGEWFFHVDAATAKGNSLEGSFVIPL
jgi:hypothetical protein